MHRAITLFALALSALALTACSHGHDEQSPLMGNAAISEETARLANLAQAQTLTPEQFDTILALSAADHHAVEELEGIRAMISYGEYTHAGHGFGFFASYVETGEHPLCPGHELAHYYVFNRHGDTERAQTALAEAKEQLSEWRTGAKKQVEEFPGPVDFATMDAQLTERIDGIARGDAPPSDTEIEALANLLCVEHS